ncbi:MAG: ABC transporter ATP-binding protein [Microthrixaceae bacterium]|nr:ABC transporter ATP-binding protein [Microthrixaceae bacterium]
MVKALDNLSLAIDAGEYVSVTGPSGCGKSTLMHLLAGLDRADSGRLEVSGEDLMRMRDPNGFRRNRVGLVFQMHNLLPHLDAKSNVMVPMLGTQRSRRERSARADELLEQVGLAEFAHRRPPQMSGGERQRVAIARALANDPAVLFADEPTGSLDSRSVERVLELIEELRKQRPVTIVMVTHDKAVANTADRIIYMVDGRVVDQPVGL